VQSLDTPFKVIQGLDFGTNRKRVYNFLLVRIVTLVLSCTVSEILQVFCSPEWPHPFSSPIFGVFPLHQMAHVGVSPSRGPKLFGREIIFEEFQPMWSRYLNVTHGQTDGRTIYDRNTALCTKVHRAIKTSEIRQAIICDDMLYPLSTGKWMQNEWPWTTLSGYFMTKSVFGQQFLNQSIRMSEIVGYNLWDSMVFCALHDQLASLIGRHAQLMRCFSVVAELLVSISDTRKSLKSVINVSLLYNIQSLLNSTFFVLSLAISGTGKATDFIWPEHS